MSPNKSTGVLLKGLAGLPVQIPHDVLKHQAQLGSIATLLWINLAACAQQRRPLRVETIAQYMGVERAEVERAMVILADHGWINDEGLEIRLMVPDVAAQAEVAATRAAELSHSEVAAHREVAASGALLSEEQAAFEWLVSYWSTRVGEPTPEEMRKFVYWMEKKGVSHEVIAVAIEETAASAPSPSFAYIEGILRNWHAKGVRTYNDLLERPYLSKVLPKNKGAAQPSEAEQKWKEVFPDEFE